MSVSAFMALSTVFYSINSPDNSLLSHSVLPVLFLPHLWLTWLKAPTNILTVRFGGLPSRSEGVAVNVFDINQPSLPTPFYSVLVSVSAFMALSTIFHSINSPDNSLLSHSVLPVLFLPHLWLTGLKAPTNILTVRFGGLPSRSEGVAVNVF